MEIEVHKFDALFEMVVGPNPAAAEVLPSAARRREPSGRTRPVPELEVRIRRALGLFHQGEYLDCLSNLQCLHGEAPGDARVEAYRAASRALAVGDTTEAVKVCVAAVKRGVHVADVCCALGVVLLRAGDRSKAIAVFRKGLAADPLHPHLRVRMRQMGVRRAPIICSLPRRHPLNRLLGALRSRLATT